MYKSTGTLEQCYPWVMVHLSCYSGVLALYGAVFLALSVSQISTVSRHHEMKSEVLPLTSASD